MKDICESCHMSRGGVYGHFSSSKEIYIEMLDDDLKVNRSIVEESIQNKASASKIMDGYFQQEIEAIFSEKNVNHCVGLLGIGISMIIEGMMIMEHK